MGEREPPPYFSVLQGALFGSRGLLQSTNVYVGKDSSLESHLTVKYYWNANLELVGFCVETSHHWITQVPLTISWSVRGHIQCRWMAGILLVTQLLAHGRCTTIEWTVSRWQTAERSVLWDRSPGRSNVHPSFSLTCIHLRIISNPELS